MVRRAWRATVAGQFDVACRLATAHAGRVRPVRLHLLPGRAPTISEWLAVRRLAASAERCYGMRIRLTRLANGVLAQIGDAPDRVGERESWRRPGWFRWSVRRW